MKLTVKQEQANDLLAGTATHIMLFGGSRSGKTFLLVRAVCMRAIKAPKSRHAILRFRFNAVKNSVVLDTFPKVMGLCFTGIKYTLNKSDWYAEFENGSQIWFGGLDDKERTEKILGMEFATIYANECSQIPYGSIETAITRLAQKATQQAIGNLPEMPLTPRVYYDCNPPPKSHWSYRIFKEKRHPETKLELAKPDDYACMQMNPVDNTANLTDGYLETLQSLGARARKRFLDGEFADATPNALFSETAIDKWRVEDSADLPDMARVIVGVDPSGSDDDNNEGNDAIGLVVVGLGTDGNGYIIEDATLKAGPATWGKMTVSAYQRHKADLIVGEQNFGGAMVRFVIKTADPSANYKIVNASRGKVQRAEPFAALFESGRIRIVGRMNDLEEELTGFSTAGYIGAKSPNRADAAFWALAEIFPGMTKPEKKEVERKPVKVVGWMR